MGRVIDDRFAAMGTAAHVRTVGGSTSVVAQARKRLASLEARWSRFRTGSDVSELNREAGRWVPVSDETVLLLQRSLQAARATEGRFDPTVGAALLAHGYDRTFAEVPARAGRITPVAVVDGAWPAIEIDVAGSAACIPAGTTFDPGGIGKGLAADLVAEELAGQADGILVNLGGDLRVCGAAADPAGWVISVDDPHRAHGELGRLAIRSGAVATSSRLARCWSTADGPAHHIIDPTTGRPAAGDVAAVTVVAQEAWWAEAQATSLFLAGPDGLDRSDPSVEALMVLRDGSHLTTPALAEVLP